MPWKIEKGIATPPEEHRRLATALLQRFGRNHGAWISAARSVFFISMAMVIGPTPPGTGVINPATSFASLKLTSPTRR
jgi:hypothetical protein